MDHGIDIERRHRAELLKIAKDLKLPLLATNDLHYVHADDADVHDVLLCIGTRTTMDDPKRFRFTGRDFYVKSAAEMRETWRDFPEACDNTLLVAERCDVQFNEKASLMPTFPVPPGRARSPGWSRRSSAASRPVSPRRGARGPSKAGGLRGRRHLPDGLPGLLPGDCGPGSLREGTTASGWVRAAARRRARSSPTPWASPSSTPSATVCCSSASSTRARVDARHRHGLRRAPPLGT